MSKFFIPVAKNKAEEEQVYLGIKKFVAEGVGASLSSRRIFRLMHQEGGKQILAEVGMEYPTNGEQVFAIFYEEELNVYYICTNNRGVEAGVPIFCGEDEVISCEDFET
jgi:hypothetical protein